MFKIGLKLWSTNTDHYLREAKKLHAEGVFDYIELYYVPGSIDVVSQWKALDIPYIVHAPHSAHGVNLASAQSETLNLKIFSEVRKFADALEAEMIVAHGGVLGSVDEIIRQLKIIEDSRILIENKPYFPIDGSARLLAGSTPEEIKTIISTVGCGFCFDVGHAIASANAHGADWRVWIADFLSLCPAMFHLSDIQSDSLIDQHLHFGTGSLPLVEMVSKLPRYASVSIETKHNSSDNLDDFARDAAYLRDLGLCQAF